MTNFDGFAELLCAHGIRDEIVLTPDDIIIYSNFLIQINGRSSVSVRLWQHSSYTHSFCAFWLDDAECFYVEVFLISLPFGK